MKTVRGAGMVIAVALLLAAGAEAVSAQSRPRVDPASREILGHRLGIDALRRADAVMRALDQAPPRGPDMPRADVTLVTVLNMAFAYSEPWRDATLHENVRLIEAGQPDLVAAIRGAGMSTRDYVLTHMTLLLAYPVAAQRRQGRAVNVTDVAPENVAWVETHWADVDRFMSGLRQRIAAARGGRP